MKEKIEKLIEEYSAKVLEATECEKVWQELSVTNPKAQATILASETYWGTKREYYEKFVVDLQTLLRD